MIFDGGNHRLNFRSLRFVDQTYVDYGKVSLMTMFFDGALPFIVGMAFQLHFIFPLPNEIRTVLIDIKIPYHIEERLKSWRYPFIFMI